MHKLIMEKVFNSIRDNYRLSILSDKFEACCSQVNYYDNMIVKFFSRKKNKAYELSIINSSLLSGVSPKHDITTYNLFYIDNGNNKQELFYKIDKYGARDKETYYSLFSEIQKLCD